MYPKPWFGPLAEVFIENLLQKTNDLLYATKNKVSWFTGFYPLENVGKAFVVFASSVLEALKKLNQSIAHSIYCENLRSIENMLTL